ncbi:MAG: hypothetical protein AABZ60_02420 [Planctomycetota bacterium]
MLNEVVHVRQIPGEPRRRWFLDEFFDLIVWLDESNTFIGFQLIYDKKSKQGVLDWRINKGYSHYKMDDGEHTASKPKATPTLTTQKSFDKEFIYQSFLQASVSIDKAVAQFVLEKIKAY